MAIKISIIFEIVVSITLLLLAINYLIDLTINDMYPNIPNPYYLSEDIYASVLTMERLQYNPTGICDNLTSLYPNLEVTVLSDTTLLCGTLKNYTYSIPFIYYYNTSIYSLEIKYNLK